MKHVLHHDLDVEQSKRVAEKALKEYRERFSQYNPTLVWLSDKRAQVSFAAKGMTVSGFVELTRGAVEVDVEVPFLFRMFRKPAMKVLDNELKRQIAEFGGSAASPEQTQEA
jgi:hypothetical protein